jgi:hypothetical protein
MMKKSIYALSAMLLLTFSACQKSGDDAPPNNADKTQLITASAWKYSDAGLDNDNNGTKDMAIPGALLPASCDTDNTLLFKSDNTGIMSEGASKCTTTDPDTVNFTWNFTNNGNSMNVSTAFFPGLDGEAKIIELTSSKLTISKTVSGFTVIVFFVH